VVNVVLSKGKILITIFAIAIVVILALYAIKNTLLVQANENTNITIGSYAPSDAFFLANGTKVDLSNYKGHEVVLWFVATWCSGCAQGDEVLNSSYTALNKKGVKVIELELYKDLGYNGENITYFVKSFAPQAYINNVVIPAYASYNMTIAYDHQGYLDIYYLISPSGKILYENSTLATTLPQLLSMINKTSVI
jgi:thiol-disulfide isomerase/thioredoxin